MAGGVWVVATRIASEVPTAPEEDATAEAAGARVGRPGDGESGGAPTARTALRPGGCSCADPALGTPPRHRQAAEAWPHFGLV